MGSRVQTSAVCTRELGYTIIVMARYSALWLVATIAIAAVTGTPARKSKEIAEYDDYYDSDTPVAVTCPGFPGYCSESYIGDTCTVVCARGRNNVPQCQEDGTWTDIPRCIEHDPGVEEQVTGVCPGIPGYCSLDWPGALCEFECPIGAAIRSSCTPDGTWEPYPTCDGDPRETQDGCNPCPGPDGGPRNRTIDAGGSNGGRSKAANKGNNKIPRNGGNKQGGGGSISGGSQNSNGGGAKQGNGGNRNRAQNAGGEQKFGGGNQNSGGQATSQSKSQNGGPRRSQNNGQNQAPSAGPGQSQNQPKTPGGQSSGGQSSGGQSSGQCPGGELQACIDVCPGFSARVFGACVTGCAKRCPAKK